jgi:hypothetical protein
MATILRFLSYGCFFSLLLFSLHSSLTPSSGIINPAYVSSAQLLAVGIFIHQSGITWRWGQGHIASPESRCRLWEQSVFRVAKDQKPQQSKRQWMESGGRQECKEKEIYLDKIFMNRFSQKVTLHDTENPGIQGAGVTGTM